MKNINLKGINAETVTGVLILLVALINAVLQMFGINTLPIENSEVSEIVSTVFLIATTLYNVYKNRNITHNPIKSNACAAAACSAAFLLLPLPAPMTFELSLTSTSNLLSWSGPD